MFEILGGIKVLDLTTVVLGPYATQMLGDFGAEIIKVEPPEGDSFRYSRPAGRNGGMSAGFLNLNRNKTSIALNLKKPDDYEKLVELVRTADVFVHNMRPSSCRELKIDYETIRAIRPDITYCCARGYGEGPWGEDPAYDDCIQAASGLASLNQDEEGVPHFVRSVLCDKIGGLHLAYSIAMALLHKERTGEGMFIETPMLETMISFLLVEHLAGKTYDPAIGEMGYSRVFSPNRRPFRTSDGWIAILPYSGRHWQRFLQLVGRNDISQAVWVVDPEQRAANIDRLYAVIAEVAGNHTTAEWLTMLRQEEIPCAPVRQLDDLIDAPELAASEMFVMTSHPTEGRLRNIRSPFRVMGVGTRPDTPAPMLGSNSIVAIPSALDQNS